MTIDSFIRRLDRTFTWLYYKHQWAEWELLITAIIAMILLLWILRRQKKTTVARNAYNDQASQRSPIIGIKLADHHHNRQVTEDAKERRSDLIAQLSGRKKRKATAKHIEDLNGQIRQLHSAINKYKDMEDRFIEKISELTTANEKLRNELAYHTQQEDLKPTSQQLSKSEAFDSPSIDEQPEPVEQEEQTDQYDVEAAELPAAQEKIQVFAGKQEQDDESTGPRTYKTARRRHQMVTEEQEDEEIQQEDAVHPRPLKRDSEPLDIQKLKAIAALARQIQGYPRQG